MKPAERLAKISEALKAVAKGEKEIEEVVADIFENKESLIAYIKEADKTIYLGECEEGEEEANSCFIDGVFQFLGWYSENDNQIFGEKHLDELINLHWYVEYNDVYYGNDELLDEALGEEIKGQYYDREADEIFYEFGEDAEVGEEMAVRADGAVLKFVEIKGVEGWKLEGWTEKYLFTDDLLFVQRDDDCEVYTTYGKYVGKIGEADSIKIYESIAYIGITNMTTGKNFICHIEDPKGWLDGGDGHFPWEAGYADVDEDEHADCLGKFAFKEAKNA